MAEFGRHALSGAALGVLSEEAVQLVASQLDVPYVTILETVEGRPELAARASVGLPEALAAERFLPRGPDGQTDFSSCSLSSRAGFCAAVRSCGWWCPRARRSPACSS